MDCPEPMPSYWSLANEVTHLRGKLDQLQAENAELRTLLLDFRDAMWDYGEWTESFDERMFELGVFRGR